MFLFQLDSNISIILMPSNQISFHSADNTILPHLTIKTIHQPISLLRASGHSSVISIRQGLVTALVKQDLFGFRNLKRHLHISPVSMFIKCGTLTTVVTDLCPSSTSDPEPSLGSVEHSQVSVCVRRVHSVKLCEVKSPQRGTF